MRFFLFAVVLSLFVLSCAQPQTESVVQPPDVAEIEKRIDAAFGTAERSEKGTIVGIDLARERTSASDDVLKAALSIPNLKRFRFAGGAVSAESFAGLTKQHELAELYLQDVPVRDAEWESLLHGIPKLARLALRRLPNLSGNELGMLPRRFPMLRNLSLIEMELTGGSLVEIAKSENLTALDVRHCSRLAAENYRCLTSMKKLVDLKVGGFAVTDDVLAAIAPIPSLRGLTIDDAQLTPAGFEKFVSESASADKLETLVLSRNMTLFDNSLQPLTKFPNLKRLTVNGMMLTGTFLEHLAEDETARPKLRQLSLRKAFLSEEGVAALKKYPELQVLDLSAAATPELIEVVLSLNQLEELDVTDCGLDADLLRLLQTMPSLKRLRR